MLLQMTISFFFVWLSQCYPHHQWWCCFSFNQLTPTSKAPTLHQARCLELPIHRGHSGWGSPPGIGILTGRGTAGFVNLDSTGSWDWVIPCGGGWPGNPRCQQYPPSSRDSRKRLKTASVLRYTQPRQPGENCVGLRKRRKTAKAYQSKWYRNGDMLRPSGWHMPAIRATGPGATHLGVWRALIRQGKWQRPRLCAPAPLISLFTVSGSQRRTPFRAQHLDSSPWLNGLSRRDGTNKLGPSKSVTLLKPRHV